MNTPPIVSARVTTPTLDRALCDLAQAKGEAEVNAATIKAQQAELAKARRHLAHALVCRVRLAGGCHPCRVAETWSRT